MAKKAKAEKKPEKQADAGGGDAAASPKAGGGGLIGLLMLGGAALASSFGVVYLMSPPPAAVAEACAPVDGHASAVIEPIAQADQTYVPLPELTITVGSAPASRFVKMNLSVISTVDGAAAVTAAEPMLIDAFNTYLRSVEMSDFEDPSFYPRMREQLARRSELVLGNQVSKGVLITEYLLR